MINGNCQWECKMMLSAEPAIPISLWAFCLPITNTFKICMYKSPVACFLGFSASVTVNSETAGFLHCIETLAGAYGQSCGDAAFEGRCPTSRCIALGWTTRT